MLFKIFAVIRQFFIWRILYIKVKVSKEKLMSLPVETSYKVQPQSSVSVKSKTFAKQINFRKAKSFADRFEMTCLKNHFGQSKNENTKANKILLAGGGLAIAALGVLTKKCKVC